MYQDLRRSSKEREWQTVSAGANIDRIILRGKAIERESLAATK